eukprot:Awhi_evm2s14632
MHHTLFYSHLDRNKLTYIEPGIFQDTPLLWSINLRENPLSAIAAGTFDGPEKITRLELGDFLHCCKIPGLFPYPGTRFTKYSCETAMGVTTMSHGLRNADPYEAAECEFINVGVKLI